MNQKNKKIIFCTESMVSFVNNKNTVICEVVLWWGRDINRSFDTGETQCYLEKDFKD